MEQVNERQTSARGLLVAAIGLAAMISLMYIESRKQIPMQEPRREFYLTQPAIVRDDGRELFVVDENQDGKADIMHQGMVYWIAEGHQTKYSCDRRTRIMSESMRGLATQTLQTQQELSYQAAYLRYLAKQGG